MQSFENKSLLVNVNSHVDNNSDNKIVGVCTWSSILRIEDCLQNPILYYYFSNVFKSAILVLGKYIYIRSAAWLCNWPLSIFSKAVFRSEYMFAWHKSSQANWNIKLNWWAIVILDLEFWSDFIIKNLNNPSRIFTTFAFTFPALKKSICTVIPEAA